MEKMNCLLCVVYFTFGNAKVSDPKLFEGDIVLNDDAMRVIKGGSIGYDAVTNTRMHWSKGIVPYVFTKSFKEDTRRTGAVLKAMNDYHKKTCIRFKPRTIEREYIRFVIGGGCYSLIGRNQYVSQDVSIGYGCSSHGTIIHELMHAIGFFHEQSRLDRDNYINIYWKNIRKGMEFNFEKYNHGEADYLGASYDLNSVMHYERTAFGNNKVTISAKSDYNLELGQRNGFAASDIYQINKMYKCSGSTSTSQPDIAKTTPRQITSKPTSSSCKDRDSYCASHVTSGYCTGGVYKTWMQINCKKSCKICR